MIENDSMSGSEEPIPVFNDSWSILEMKIYKYVPLPSSKHDESLAKGKDSNIAMPSANSWIPIAMMEW